MNGMPSRTRVLVTGSICTWVVSGTCLMQATTYMKSSSKRVGGCRKRSVLDRRIHAPGHLPLPPEEVKGLAHDGGRPLVLALHELLYDLPLLVAHPERNDIGLLVCLILHDTLPIQHTSLGFMP